MDPRLLYALLALAVIALAFVAYRLYWRKSPSSCPSCPTDPACVQPLLTNNTAGLLIGLLSEMYTTGCQCPPGDAVAVALNTAGLAASNGDRSGMMAALGDPAVKTQLTATLTSANASPDFLFVYLIQQVAIGINTISNQDIKF